MKLHPSFLPISRASAFVFCLVLALPLILFPSGDTAIAQSPKDEIGVWDGAVWRFQQVPRKGNPSKCNLRGRFRIEALVLYQGEGPEDKEIKREIGKSESGTRKETEVYHSFF